MMMACITYLRARFASKKGQGMVEYGLIIGIIAVIIVASLTVLRTPIETLFGNIEDLITGHNGTLTTAPTGS